ncbi:TIGR02281 family clan AA aspartic protease [Sphingobium sp. 10 DY56-G10]|nr:hypothetical protein SKA58_00550 [Sphingomonas sp. SKA58]
MDRKPLPLVWQSMDISINPEWQRLLPYALGGAVVLLLLFNIPFIGRILRALLSIGLLAIGLLILAQRAPFDPALSQIQSRLGWADQETQGNTVRIRMSPDGHFWARATVNGVPRRMLIDSGATVTAISQDTARAASVAPQSGIVPVLMRTANGTVRVETGTIDRLEIGGLKARDLSAVISPALGDVDILGMNFLTQLASWRVEGRTLILEPSAPAAG